MLKRNITDKATEALQDTPVVLLNGPRQSGKSTLAKSFVSAGKIAKYITFDVAAAKFAAQSDPAAFIQALPASVVLDEAQRVKELFLAIKIEVDENRKSGRFLLTGSADILLLPNLVDSLAGRMEILTLWPLSQGEINNKKENFIDAVFDEGFSCQRQTQMNFKQLVEIVMRGGYPEILSRSKTERRHAWFDSYITTILQRDIRDLANIEGLTELPRLFSILATRAGSLINAAELSRSSSIPQTTLKRYMTLLEMTFLIVKLPAWSNNQNKRLVKAPKIFINDAGLLSYLLGMDEKKIEEDRSQFGHILENFIVMELMKQKSWSKLQPKLYHFRSQAGQEVDIVIEDRQGNVVGIEVKSSSQITNKDLRGLSALQEHVGPKFIRGIVLYTGRESVAFSKNIAAMPIDALWS